MTEECLSFVEAVFCAAHYSPEGEDHGHDYLVRAYFPAGRDARGIKRELEAALAEYDHRRLPPSAQWDNLLAPLLGEELGAARLQIYRPLQGIGCEWRAG